MLLNTTRSGPVASFKYHDDAWPDRHLSNSGRRNRLDETVNGVTRQINYDYDNLNRLKAENLALGPNVGSITYDTQTGHDENPVGLDRVGNRNRRVISLTPEIASQYNLPNGTINYASYDVNDRLGNTLQSGTVAAEFDANGNTLRFNLGENNAWDESLADVYDRENRLVSATRSGESSSFVYDGDGNRVQKTVGSTTTYYLIDDRNLTGYAQVIEERTSLTGPPVAKYVYGLDLISQARGLTTNYYGYDGLGSVRYLTQGNPQSVGEGQITDTYVYDAFGIQIDGSGSTLNAYRYTGEQYDATLQMYYLRARYYRPEVGRFWTMDSFEGSLKDPLGLHKYLYTRGDPVNRIDPSGNVDWTLIGQLVQTAIRVGLAAYNTVSLIKNVKSSATAAIQAFNAFDNGDMYNGYGYATKSILDGSFAVLNAIGLKSFFKSPPGISGGLTIAWSSGTAALYWEAVKLSNPAVRKWLGKELIPAILGSGLVNFSAVTGDGNGGGDDSGGGGEQTSSGGSSDPVQVLQTGGHTIRPRTAKLLGMTKDQAKQAMENLKQFNGLPPNFHQTKIMSNGDVINRETNELIDNLWSHLH